MSAAFRTLVYGNAILLLMLTTLMWGGNTIAGRLAIGEVSPMMVVALRWVIVSSVMTVTMWSRIRAEWPLIRASMGKIVLMAVFGFTGFNSLFYAAAHYTTAVNLGILQGSMPMLVLLGALLFYRVPVRPLQILGIFATMTGVAMIAAQGSLETLLKLTINPGDGLMLIACVFYAGYTLALRSRPQISGLVFFTVLSIVAAITSIPGILYESAAGILQVPTFKGWLIILYVALGPSCLSQIFFMRGVELIGPARAGIFINLVPIFAAILAVLILGEDFRMHHALALTLVLGGIWLSERRSKAATQVQG
ncbi:DMT family transporter [Roseibium suaedae]|uniref:Permease of the drug/metabolite transporter (DMT) superfamily n=1 Tax=Roseibium suaedae TaxID=735517 RepID=A0A1M7BWF4_9HYPH|nr:DMT family transporter [Roseibium suaedae]SHL59358.1 Permease of the drug/metabolite transporter (DMT) superfamily [Roseibium suaedae]